MEQNTFATSAYISAPFPQIVEYLADLKNLDEWTMFSRMQRQIDESTWLGTASGYQRPLYYHVKRFECGPLQGIEWHTGFSHGVYHQVYPVLVFPPSYPFNGNPAEPGAYVHWISFTDPARRTQMITEGLPSVHTAECRALKAALERAAGLRHPAQGRSTVHSESIYIDAPLDLGLEYLADVGSLTEYAFNLRPDPSGTFVDEYNRRLAVTSRQYTMGEMALVEHEHVYVDDDVKQRSVTLLVPCSYAFGQPSARGFIKHRITFQPRAGSQTLASPNLDDLRAESINAKRRLESKAGNPTSFARGLSYLPPA
jgi:hypothetical protein